MYMQKYEIKLQLKRMLKNILSFPLYLDELREEDTYLKNLAMDSFEMFILMAEIEKTFKIRIEKDEIDVFIFQLQESEKITSIKYITIGNTIDYIYQKIHNNFIKNT